MAEQASKKGAQNGHTNSKKTKERRKHKRGQNEGSIYQRKDGRWTGVINLGYQNGKLKRKSFYGKTRDDVQKSLTTALHDHQRALPVAMPRQTVKQFLERWLEDCVKPTVRPATYNSYEQQVRVHIAPFLGHHQLTKLGPQHIQRYMNEKARPVPQPDKDKPKAGLSAKTIGYHRSLLVMALGQAERWGLVARNVATLVDPPRRIKYEIQPITPEQARQFLEAIKGNRLEALFTVALSLGLRRGEALGLRWQDIDFESAHCVCISRLLESTRSWCYPNLRLKTHAAFWTCPRHLLCDSRSTGRDSLKTEWPQDQDGSKRGWSSLQGLERRSILATSSVISIHCSPRPGSLIFEYTTCAIFARRSYSLKEWRSRWCQTFSDTRR